MKLLRGRACRRCGRGCARGARRIRSAARSIALAGGRQRQVIAAPVACQARRARSGRGACRSRRAGVSVDLSRPLARLSTVWLMPGLRPISISSAKRPGAQVDLAASRARTPGTRRSAPCAGESRSSPPADRSRSSMTALASRALARAVAAAPLRPCAAAEAVRHVCHASLARSSCAGAATRA